MIYEIFGLQMLSPEFGYSLVVLNKEDSASAPELCTWVEVSESAYQEAVRRGTFQTRVRKENMTIETFPGSKIIVALDRMCFDDAFSLMERLQGKVWGCKLRLPLMLRHGISWAKKFGNVMADPKCYDIESSMVDDIKALAGEGADLITIHCSASSRRMKACVKACEGTQSRLLAVTILTDSDSEDIMSVYGDAARRYAVGNLWRLAHEACVHGVVCGFGDIPLLVPQPTLVVCPGFRPSGTATNEQKATGGYEDAKKASLVVVGRPITEASDPLKAVEEFNKGLAL